MTAMVGMNVGAVSYWSTQDPFLDRFKTSSAWLNDTNARATNAKFDADGYPLGIPDGTKTLATIIGLDPLSSGKTNIYELSYSGTGTITVAAGATVISSKPGEIVFRGTAATCWVVIKADSASDPIHNIHVVRQDQVALFNSGEIFNTDFLEEVSHWHTLRFMDWENTNATTMSSWSDRPEMGDSSWAGANGVPLEAMVKLSNQAHTNMWFTIPTQADDNYVRQALEYIKQNLSPGLKVEVEYSNEVWNGGFAQFKYAQDKANTLWGHDTNGNGTIEGSEVVSGGNQIYYGYRSAQISAIAHDVFGASAPSRLVEVLAGQTVNPSLASGYQAKGVALAGKGSLSSLFSEYAVTTYFGSQFGSSNVANQDKIYAWATSGESGLTAAFKELEHGGALSKDDSLDAVVKYYVASAAFAKANGLDMVAYEGGADLEYYMYSADRQPTIKAFFSTLMNDPRMGALYTKMIDDFAAAGGKEANILTDVSGITPWGYWGVLDSIYQDGSPRYDALVAYAAAHNVKNIMGTSSNDILVGSAGADMIIGQSDTKDASGHYIESDYYSGGPGSDIILGGAGNDHIFGNSAKAIAGSADGGDSLSGGAGNDYVQGNAGNDTIDGGTGNDRLYGGADADLVTGGAGQDYLQGNRGADTLSGGDGLDLIRGGAENDQIAGDGGDDTLYGDAGNDILRGGPGHDVLVGGAGSDTFIFQAGDANFTTTGTAAYVGDEISDFTHGIDKLSLGFTVGAVLTSSNSFTTASAGAVYAQQLLNGHTGAGEVAAVVVGEDTYLFYNAAGTDTGAIDSMIKVDGVTPSQVAISDFV